MDDTSKPQNPDSRSDFSYIIGYSTIIIGHCFLKELDRHMLPLPFIELDTMP